MAYRNQRTPYEGIPQVARETCTISCTPSYAANRRVRSSDRARELPAYRPYGRPARRQRRGVVPWVTLKDLTKYPGSP
jgi:hypothetical protein